ncbi:MAG: hypothetical protein HOM06_13640, partial [Gammaproteobacteria bacterium]|nr:hypothetical protein [Gammaproteobacteria bacterium]
SDDLDDLDLLEDQLEHAGIDSPRIHVLSNDSVGVANHIHLHAVQSIFTRDVVHCTIVGAMIGLLGVCLVLGVTYVLDLPDAIIGWTPYIFLSIVVLGFCTWEGGFVGMQKTNYHYKQFESALEDGKHVFIVDLDPNQESSLTIALQDHPKLLEAATEVGSPHWILASLHWLTAFIDRNLFSSAQQKTHLSQGTSD